MNRPLPLTVCASLLSFPGAAAAREPSPAPPAGAAKAKAASPQGGHSCEAEALGTPSEDRVAKRTDPKTGAAVLAAGARLSGAAAVGVADLLKTPEKWAGKTVRLEGYVSAMCTHRRAWFAIQADDRSGGYVRVIAAPSFLVPEGSIGKRARTEGRVELVDVPADTAQHYAQEHQLSTQLKAVIVRAAGAEFL